MTRSPKNIAIEALEKARRIFRDQGVSQELMCEEALEALRDESWVMVPRKITPEMAYELESEIATPLSPDPVHAANWQSAWERLIEAAQKEVG